MKQNCLEKSTMKNNTGKISHCRKLYTSEDSPVDLVPMKQNKQMCKLEPPLHPALDCEYPYKRKSYKKIKRPHWCTFDNGTANVAKLTSDYSLHDTQENSKNKLNKIPLKSSTLQEFSKLHYPNDEPLYRLNKINNSTECNSDRSRNVSLSKENCENNCLTKLSESSCLDNRKNLNNIIKNLENCTTTTKWYKSTSEPYFKGVEIYSNNSVQSNIINKNFISTKDKGQNIDTTSINLPKCIFDTLPSNKSEIILKNKHNDDIEINIGNKIRSNSDSKLTNIKQSVDSKQILNITRKQYGEGYKDLIQHKICSTTENSKSGKQLGSKDSTEMLHNDKLKKNNSKYYYFETKLYESSSDSDITSDSD